MQKYLVLYMMPTSGLDAWKEKPEAERKEAELKMQQEWQAWGAANAGAILEAAGAGAAKRVTKAGIADARNEIMLYSIVQAESDEAIAKMFENHPHLGIPEAWIDIMPANVIPGMGA